eukprot:4198370-Prorocentrum_lima.AAC.1
MHPNLRTPRPTAGSGVVDEVRRDRSAPSIAPTTLLNACKRNAFGSKSRRNQENARRVEGVGAAER